MDDDRIAMLEARVDRIERGFRYLPLALLAVFSVAALVFILLGG